MSTGGGYRGQEFATGPSGFKTVILAEDPDDAGRMLAAAAGIPGFSANPVPDEAAVEALSTWAREMRDWSERDSDEHGPVPLTWYYDEGLARVYMEKALLAGKMAVRIESRRIGDEYPNAGEFYQRYYAIRDAVR